MMPTVVVLAGGLGTRLRKVTDDKYPKPMVPVLYQDEEYPFLSFLLEYLKTQGAHHVVICLDHLGEKIESYFGDGRAFDLDIEYDTVHGVLTGARLKHAMRKVKESEFIVHCGDTYHPIDLQGFINHFESHPEITVQVSVVTTAHDPALNPNIAMNQDGMVTAYARDNVRGSQQGLETGILAVRNNILDVLPDKAGVSLTEDVYPELIAQHRIRAYESNTLFFDIGTPDEYLEFCRYAQEHEIKPVSRNPVHF